MSFALRSMSTIACGVALLLLPVLHAADQGEPESAQLEPMEEETQAVTPPDSDLFSLATATERRLREAQGLLHNPDNFIQQAFVSSREAYYTEVNEIAIGYALAAIETARVDIDVLASINPDLMPTQRALDEMLDSAQSEFLALGASTAARSTFLGPVASNLLDDLIRRLTDPFHRAPHYRHVWVESIPQGASGKFTLEGDERDYGTIDSTDDYVVYLPLGLYHFALEKNGFKVAQLKFRNFNIPYNAIRCRLSPLSDATYMSTCQPYIRVAVDGGPDDR
jgi:hypothetical protein